jgi:DNA processing protein
MTAQEVAAATLVCLPSMSPARLRALLARFGDPVSTLAAVQRGDATVVLLDACPASRVDVQGALARSWSRADARAMETLLVRRGTHVLLETSAEYPIAEATPDRPPVLLAEGERVDAFRAPRVAIVGTRSATPHGLADAYDLATFLARAGVTVVSGLAIGIDGAAHTGALDAGGATVGVVATGLDVEYPRRHAGLYARTRAGGLVLGETGFGVRPARSRFPVRNRIIALLADVVVVIEATADGGARITAGYAAEYGRPVLAVPGSRRNPAAAGTNALLADGAHPLLDWSDVLLALGLQAAAASRTGTPKERCTPTGDDARVLAVLGGEAATAEELAGRTRLDPTAVALAIRSLERAGWVTRAHGAVWPV